MSRTYEIVCHECRVRLWIGQGWPPDRVRIYKGGERLDWLEEFLFAHQRHRIEFGDDEPLGCQDYSPLHEDDDETDDGAKA